MAVSLFDLISTASMLGAFIYIGRKLQVLEDLNKTTNKIKINVKVIGDYLTGASVGFNHAELQAYGPLRLTNEGNELIKQLGFDKVFEKHRAEFFGFIVSEKPKLKYDVEKAAISSVSMLYNKKYMDFLKVFFFNNPDRNLRNVAPTLGVYLRDKYLEAHPGITK